MNFNDDFMAKLRTGTSSIHDQLEQTPLSRSLMDPAVSAEDYAAYLQAMLVIHRAMETSVFPVAETVFGELDARKKVPLLTSDLEALGVSGNQHGAPFLDTSYSSDAAFNAGMLYVSEGSTLGGKIILKHVLAGGNTELTGAMRFFDCYGTETGSRWKSFLTTLATYQQSLDEAGRDRIVAGAVYGFSRTAAVFNQAAVRL